MSEKQTPKAQPKDDAKQSDKQSDKSNVHPLSTDELKDVSGGALNAYNKEEQKK